MRSISVGTRYRNGEWKVGGMRPSESTKANTYQF